MQSGGKNVIKTQKTKPRYFENDENQIKEKKKQKKKDKSVYRLQKQENDYVV